MALDHCSGANPGEFYVDAHSGTDDPNLGTNAKPWRTLGFSLEQIFNAHFEDAIVFVNGSFTTAKDVNLNILASVAGGRFNLTIDGGNAARSMVDCQKAATFIKTCSGADVSLKNVQISRCIAQEVNGGAINAINAKSLSLYNVTLSENEARKGVGGAIVASNTKVIITSTLFIDNIASSCGALSLNSSSASIRQSSFLNNIVTVNGGALCALNSDVLMEATTAKNNKALYGAAVSCFATNLTMSRGQSFINNTDASGGGSEWLCDNSCAMASSDFGFSNQICNMTLDPIVLDPSVVTPIFWTISAVSSDLDGANVSMHRIQTEEDGQMTETLRYEIVPYSSGVNVTLLFASDFHPQLGTYFIRWTMQLLQEQTHGGPGGVDYFPIKLNRFEWLPVGRIRRIAQDSTITDVEKFSVSSVDGILHLEMIVANAPVLIGTTMHASFEKAHLSVSMKDFAGVCQSLELYVDTYVTTQFSQDYTPLNVSSGSGWISWENTASAHNTTKLINVGNSDPKVVQVPSGGFSYLPVAGFTVSEIQYTIGPLMTNQTPTTMRLEIGYNVGARTVLGVSIMQMTVFLGPRLFLFATGIQRCQQLLLLPKVVASVYPPMVKNKIIVSVVLGIFPFVLAMFHLAVGDSIHPLQFFEWIAETASWLFSTWVLYLEHSRAMPQSWIPLRTWWILAFYAQSMNLYTKLSTVSDLDIMFFPYLLQYVCYVSMLLLALLHTSSSFEYSQLLRGGTVERVGKQDKGAVFVAVTLAMFTGQLVYGLAMLILPNYAQMHGITRSELGLIVGSYAVAILVTSPFFGYLSKTYGRRNMLLGGLSGLSVATVMFAFADSLWSLMLARIFQGFAAAANFTSGQAVLADTFPQERLGAVLGTAAGWSGLGLLLGPPLGGFLYELGGYSLPFLIGAALSFIDVFVVALLMEDTKFEDRPAKLDMLWHTRVPIITGVIVLGSCSMTMMEPTLPVFIQQTFKVHLSTVGLLLGCGVCVYGIASPICGWLSDRYGRTRVMSIGLILLGITLPLLTAPRTLFGEGCVLAFLGMSSAMAVVATLPELAQEVHTLGSNSYEEVYSIFNTAYAFGNIIGPVCGLFLIDVISITPTYTIFGILVALYVIPLNLWKRNAADLVASLPRTNTSSSSASNSSNQPLIVETMDDDEIPPSRHIPVIPKKATKPKTKKKSKNTSSPRDPQLEIDQSTSGSPGHQLS